MAHYDIHKLNSIQQLRGLFPNGKADHMNWCLLSTSGIHGSYTTLEELKDKRKRAFHAGEKGEYITVLVIQPRLVCLYWGCIQVAATDIEWLERLVATSLEEIAISQKGNAEIRNES